ncbi:hypothetical protein BC832DRAFT_537763 [Gaertneriomyces semiglobifer]|nr:hypothetical protein BC832DRAFT_537763 [Gaertneriomyces semiglobifer]
MPTTNDLALLLLSGQVPLCITLSSQPALTSPAPSEATGKLYLHPPRHALLASIVKVCENYWGAKGELSLTIPSNTTNIANTSSAWRAWFFIGVLYDVHHSIASQPFSTMSTESIGSNPAIWHLSYSITGTSTTAVIPLPTTPTTVPSPLSPSPSLQQLQPENSLRQILISRLKMADYVAERKDRDAKDLRRYWAEVWWDPSTTPSRASDAGVDLDTLDMLRNDTEKDTNRLPLRVFHMSLPPSTSSTVTGRAPTLQQTLLTPSVTPTITIASLLEAEDIVVDGKTIVCQGIVIKNTAKISWLRKLRGMDGWVYVVVR